MKPLYKFFDIKPMIIGFFALMLLASCSSYQYAGYESDGIYSSGNQEAYTSNDYEESYDDALYYKQLFAEKSAQLENVPEEGAIFTNIEGYSSHGTYEDEFMDEGLDYQAGYGGWGDEIDEVSINIYNNSPYYAPYYAGYYDPFYGPRYGYGYGWNYGYGYGYHHPSFRWNIGFGYGWNHWNRGWAYNPYYRHGYHGYGYGYGGYYSTPYYKTQRNVAYNNTRRNSYSDYSNNTRTVSRAGTSRIQDYSNTRNVRASRSNDSNNTALRSNRSSSRTYSTRTSRVEPSKARTTRSNTTYKRSSRSIDTKASRARTTRSNNRSTQTRSSSQSRSNNSGSVRSSSSSSRSSGTTSSRSSGSRRGNN